MEVKWFQKHKKQTYIYICIYIHTYKHINELIYTTQQHIWLMLPSYKIEIVYILYSYDTSKEH